ncbi:MAG TPA: hypothetical protein VEJ20_02320 [Candidatus Eremiobacteraceae bacterium]|nr:hypothetical protein [Candidatus Eremiobacteraceae bacterium]
MDAASSDDVLLRPLRDVLSAGGRGVLASGGGPIMIEILAPPFPCAGIGSERVVRVAYGPEGTSLVAAYDAYVRL